MPLYTPSASAVWGPADQGLIAWNYDTAMTGGGSAALATAGTLYVQAVKLPAAASVTNILAELIVNGATLTSGQCFAALYQGAGGALLGTTADQSTAWGAGAPSLITMPIAGGPVTAAAGTLYVALWFNGTTGPTFYRASATTSFINAGKAAAASRWGTADTGKTTTAPSTLGTISAAANTYWVALS